VIWRCRDVTFDLTDRVLVMGIVNVTPDSFSDGGRYLEPALAVARCHELLAEGADIVDLGGESTRPGSAAVAPDEQWRRLEPVLTQVMRGRPDAVLSVDTRSADVANRALAAGARIVNDVSALADPAMAGVVAPAGAGLVLMHMRGTPETMQRDTAYGDVTAEVTRERVHRTRPRHRLRQIGPGLARAARTHPRARRHRPSRAGGRFAQELPRPLDRR